MNSANHRRPAAVQSSIFDPMPATVRPERIKGESLEDQYNRFHRANPHVYTRLRSLALGMVRQGRTRIGIGMLFEVMRWQHAMSTADPSSEFKLNNNYRAFYARSLMANVPELVGAFEIRRQRCKGGSSADQ